MDWEALNRAIPKVKIPSPGEALHSVSVVIAEGDAWSLAARSPGARWPETDPVGGDFDCFLIAGGKSASCGYADFFRNLEAWVREADVSQKRSFIGALAS